MNNIKRFLLNFLVAIALYIGLPGIAAACGTCSNSTSSFSPGQTSDSVYTSATLALGYFCDGYVEAVVTAPNGTSDFEETDPTICNCSDLYVSASVLKGTQDGTFYNQANYSSGDLGSFSRTAQQNVAPWIQLYNTSSPASDIPRQSGFRDFTVYVRLSDNCSGSFSSNTRADGPANYLGGVCYGVCPNYSSSMNSDTHSQTGGSWSWNFGIVTDPQNTVGGGGLQMTATASLATKPPSCQERAATNTSKAWTIQ